MEEDIKTAYFKCSPACDDYWDLFESWVENQEIGGWELSDYHSDWYDRDNDILYLDVTFVKI